MALNRLSLIILSIFALIGLALFVIFAPWRADTEQEKLLGLAGLAFATGSIFILGSEVDPGRGWAGLGVAVLIGGFLALLFALSPGMLGA
jgi:hypothetical protein